MSAHDLETLLSWRGRTVRDPSGDKIGKLGDLYLDADTDLPAYAGVRTGLLGTHESIVPLDGAREDDGDVVVVHDAERVRAAPSLGPGAALTPDEEDALDQHYGLARPTGDSAGARDIARPASDPAAARDVARPAPGADDDGSMVRSEEELRVGVEELAPVERVRLKKVLVTEEVKQVVPVRREVIQLETDAPPGGAIESVEELEGPPPER